MKCKNCDGERLAHTRLCGECERARVRKAMAAITYHRMKTPDLARLATATRDRLALMTKVLAERSDYEPNKPPAHSADCRP